MFWVWYLFTLFINLILGGCWYVLSPTTKETSYSDTTRDLFNILPTKLNTLLSPLLSLLQAIQKKKFRRLSVQLGLRGSNDVRVGRKIATFQLLFQSREQVVVRRSQIRRIGWVIKTLEAELGQFLLGYKCPMSRGIVVQEQDILGDLPAAFFLQNVLQLHQQR